MRRITAIAFKEFLHILRDPRSLVVALVMPLMMVLLYGYAIDMELRRLPVAVLDLDHSSASRALISSAGAPSVSSRSTASCAPLGCRKWTYVLDSASVRNPRSVV